MNLPPVVAEFGPYRLALRCRDGETSEGLFEARVMHDGEERWSLLVWGVPTPEEVETLLESHGLAPDGSPSSAAADPGGLRDRLLPPVVYAEDSLNRGTR
ncbi:hypothetical protein [Rubrobacter aplysinae]|uniref:hypothetical protein n=1 Tax=Rubrobacter aplysinae TaxID=909625 RepID=UPI00064B912C|nr:hypothetical protein [Rubrobacter aplysinae]